jgi:Kae1-associated kinase Bud32
MEKSSEEPWRRGAESSVYLESTPYGPAVLKLRHARAYRIPKLDTELRKERTRREAKLLHHAKLAGVPAPLVYCVSGFEIWMQRVDGSRPKMSEAECKNAGKMLKKLHSAGISHGDFTPANLLASKNGLVLIDFGLGFFSNDIEDYAVDALTMENALSGKAQKLAFRKGYSSEKVFARVAEVRRRARYATSLQAEKEE